MNPFLNSERFSQLLGVKSKDRAKCFGLLRNMRNEWKDNVSLDWNYLNKNVIDCFYSLDWIEMSYIIYTTIINVIRTCSQESRTPHHQILPPVSWSSHPVPFIMIVEDYQLLLKREAILHSSLSITEMVRLWRLNVSMRIFRYRKYCRCFPCQRRPEMII